jgi:hypothetical protein
MSQTRHICKIADVSSWSKKVFNFWGKWDTCPLFCAYNEINLWQQILGEYSQPWCTKNASEKRLHLMFSIVVISPRRCWSWWSDRRRDVPACIGMSGWCVWTLAASGRSCRVRSGVKDRWQRVWCSHFVTTRAICSKKTCQIIVWMPINEMIYTIYLDGRIWTRE